jgi:hypothetical protein
MGVKLGVTYFERNRLRVSDDKVLAGTDGPVMKGMTQQQRA